MFISFFYILFATTNNNLINQKSNSNILGGIICKHLKYPYKDDDFTTNILRTTVAPCIQDPHISFCQISWDVLSLHQLIYCHPVLLQSLLSSYLHSNQSKLSFCLCLFLSLPSYLQNHPALHVLWEIRPINTGSNECGCESERQGGVYAHKSQWNEASSYQDPKGSGLLS